MKKGLFIALATLSITLIATFTYFKGNRYQVVITQIQIDQTLEKNFPVTKKALLFFDVTYSNPQASLLKEDDRIKVGLDATLHIRINNEKKNIGGSCTLTSGLRYEAETYEFFLDNAQFEQFSIEGIPNEYLERVTQFVSKAAKKYLEQLPIYELKAKDSKTAVAKALLKSFEIKNQSIYVSLGL